MSASLNPLQTWMTVDDIAAALQGPGDAAVMAGRGW
jgi:hypothetical protein